MASTPAQDRSVLESKERDELQEIAQAIGVKTPPRASKASLISAIIGGPESSSDSSESSSNGDTSDSGSPSSRGASAVRSRRTVATPDTDFDEFVKEITGDETTSEVATEEGVTPSPGPSIAPSERTPRNDRQPRDYNNGGGNSNGNGADGNRNRRNRRNRNTGGGRERFDREPQSGADQPYTGELVEVQGLLDLRDDGYGFLRTKGYHPSPNDVYVSISQVRRYQLRKGDTIVGGFRPAGSNEKYPALLRVDTVQGFDPEVARLRPKFEDLTPLFTDEKLKLETNEGKMDLTPRIVDLIAPIGKGQRGLIVSPPKAGKTTVVKQIAQSIEANNPEVHLLVLLVDERPEEVTDMRRGVHGEVVASTFDRPADEHTHIAELAIERAKRLVEQGRDVVIILDGITRLARAYNLAQPATGRIMSGGVDSGALYPPKKFFGAARNIEEGGSLTILATALVETGSKMDEVIFEEFKGTGNMELKLDRRLAERRLYPAIDVNGSSTRHEELLFDREQLAQVWKLRRVLSGLSAEGREAAGLELLIDKLKQTKSNDEFLAEIAKGANPTS